MMQAVTKDDVRPRSLTGRVLGRYEVLTQLASGGMASVYVGRAKGVAGFERLVAIKVLHPHLAYETEFITMFLDEARLAARIRHPNVVATLDISDTEGDGFFIVMDYVEGDHLGALLAACVRCNERLAPKHGVRALLDAMHGLDAAHRLEGDRGEPLRLVHRDISPHNILVGTDGVARLTDFGVAKAENRLTSTRDGQFKGKLAYMAPEQASTGKTDQRSDLFAMGVVLWESLAGKRLFRAENNAATLAKILSEPIPKLAEVAPELACFDPLLAKALDRDPNKRFQTAEDMAEELEILARRNGLLGTAKELAEEVRKRLSEKLDGERGRVQAALAGAPSPVSLSQPLPRDHASGSHSGTALASGEVTRKAGRGATPRLPAGWRPAIMGAVAALLLSSAALAVFLRASKDDVAPAPQAPQAVEVPAEQHSIVELEPAPAAVAEVALPAVVEPATPAPSPRVHRRARQDIRENPARQTELATPPANETPAMAEPTMAVTAPSLLDNPYRQ